ncbi:HEAT repeat domain-containing protein [Streptomyces sp. ISL-100]|uniref:HEAT repeat domain-containing protein n=1 Tax=Streptomyces sp. ISL-100 TaxID=2819173 RepID=UPI001BE8C0A9|nr:HEAT repeat domain-containing protein [Streptomyces sp. ISL-100]MBT2398721.1 HEAT repeat domain-containing protein [Streptomyces sp. ISL-100]
MFGRWKARRQEVLRQQLATELRSPEGTVREEAAGRIARLPDTAWALRELMWSLDNEPSVDVFESVAGSFTVALREDPALYTEAERIFAEYLSDPAGLVRSWASFIERLGAVSAYTVDDELCWDIRARQGTMRELGWTEEGAPGSAPTYAHYLKLQRAIMDVHAALRRSAPLSPGTAERVRAEARVVLDQALAHPPGSGERAELLIIDLAGSPDSRAWRDRACAGARLDEILALCGSGDLTRVSVGVEALDYLMMSQIYGRTGPILAALGSLAVPGQEVFVLAKVLDCYRTLAIDHQLDEMPVALFLSCARHAHPDVRSSAAAGLCTIPRNSLEEAVAVDVLVELLDHDPDHDVRSRAGISLAIFTCGDEANTRRASAALARYADSPDAALRSSSVSGALQRNEPQAVRRLLDELQSPDPDWHFVLLAESCATDLALEDDTPSALLSEFEQVIVRLQQSGWAERGDPDGYPDPEDRAGMLALVLENLREFAS